jgi:hypothetical protein
MCGYLPVSCMCGKVIERLELAAWLRSGPDEPAEPESERPRWTKGPPPSEKRAVELEQLAREHGYGDE